MTDFFNQLIKKFLLSSTFENESKLYLWPTLRRTFLCTAVLYCIEYWKSYHNFPINAVKFNISYSSFLPLLLPLSDPIHPFLFACLADIWAGLSNLHCYQLLDKMTLVVTSRTSSVKYLLYLELQAHHSKGCITYQHVRCKTSQKPLINCPWICLPCRSSIFSKEQWKLTKRYRFTTLFRISTFHERKHTTETLDTNM